MTGNGSENTDVFKQLLGGRTPGIDEICSEFVKVLNIVGLSWLTYPCNTACSCFWVDKLGGLFSYLKKRDQRVYSKFRGMTLLPLPWESLCQCAAENSLFIIWTSDSIGIIKEQWGNNTNFCPVFPQVWGMGPFTGATRPLHNYSETFSHIEGKRSDLFLLGVGLCWDCPLLCHFYGQNFQPSCGGGHVWFLQDNPSVFCRWWSSFGFIKEWPPAHTGSAGMRISTSKSEDGVLLHSWMSCFSKWRSFTWGLVYKWEESGSI